MNQEEATEYANGLRAFADWVQLHGAEVESLSRYAHFNAYLTKTDYGRNEETGEYESSINEVETKKNLKSFLKAVGNCEKKWSHGSLTVKKDFGGGVMLEGNVNREVVCVKVPTGEVKHIPETVIPARTEEEFEWVCNEPSLMKIVEGV